MILSALFTPASSWEDASDLGHNPTRLDKQLTESSAWQGPHLYPSFGLAVSSIFKANCHETQNLGASQVNCVTSHGKNNARYHLKEAGGIFRLRACWRSVQMDRLPLMYLGPSPLLACGCWWRPNSRDKEQLGVDTSWEIC